MIAIDRRTCIDYSKSSKLEWLETNGAGGFAMGTVAGVNTRRYHGLLVASLRPPVDRQVLLSRLDETVIGDGKIELATNQYPGALSPTGYQRLTEFRLDPFPTWVFDVGGAHLTKQLFLVQGEQTVVVQYSCSRARLLVAAPFLAFRDYHSLAHANSLLDGRAVESSSDAALTLRFAPYAGLPPLHLHASPGASFAADGGWYYNTEYLEELERGLDFREDLFRAGSLTFDLAPGEPVFVVASLGSGAFDAHRVRELEQAERARRKPSSRDPQQARIEAAADQFIVRRADGRSTIIAGYPWFTDWGRDTMIALPGLLIARGRLDEAREVLRAFLQHLDKGIIPNRFPDRPGEHPEYNTVDATLWMFQAVHSWLQAGGDRAFLRDEFFPAAKEILRWHRDGTHHGIRVDPFDGLLAAGEPGVQLTWMDARVGDRVITPRHGKPVEINALYYNALQLAAAWAAQLGETDVASAYAREAARVEGSFVRAFWNEARGCLYDVIGPSGPDASLRPNQLFAISLPFPLLSVEQRQSVVRVVERELLTPMGLRTLARGELGYVGRYGGNVELRDGAYHQGTVWPWLIGAYVRARLTAFGRTQAALAYCRAVLEPLLAHLEEACLGAISEVFDGDSPHRPGGAPAQAWSVAELLHLLLVELAEPARDRGSRAVARDDGRPSPRGTS